MEAKIEEWRNGVHGTKGRGNERDERVKMYLENNRKWTQSKDYEAPITFLEMQEKGRANEDGSVIVLACTDPRCTPEEYLGMSSKSGNKATIIRTAGARATTALSTLLVLSAVGNHGQKGSIMVIGHTDCGLQSVDEGEIRGILRGDLESLDGAGDGIAREGDGDGDGERMGEREVDEARDMLGKMSFGSFISPDESVTEDISMLKRLPFFRGMKIEGFIQDTETGVLWGMEEWRRECKTDELVRVDERRGRLFDG